MLTRQRRRTMQSPITERKNIGTVSRRGALVASSGDSLLDASGTPALYTDEPPSQSDEATFKDYRPASPRMWFSLAVIVLLSIYAVLVLAELVPSGASTPRMFVVSKVWWSSWLTAAVTGLGIFPFLCSRGGKSLGPFWLAVCNAAAAGMMLAASGMLIFEGATHVHEYLTSAADAAGSPGDDFHWLSWDRALVRTAIGFFAGVLFLWLSKKWLDDVEHLRFSTFEGLDARKSLLLLAVMTLHSLSEGVGLGVSFGSDYQDASALFSGDTTVNTAASNATIVGGVHTHGRFGQFISSALAIHNLPEGAAICLVLVPRGVSRVEAALWAIFTSLPQPLMAVPAFLSVQLFLPLLPAGLGFAAGAMSSVVLELLPEAIAGCGTAVAFSVFTLAGIAMLGMQLLLH